MKGETVTEITAAAKVMRAKATRIPVGDSLVDLDRDEINVDRETVVDTCGTGGDATHTFNVSTTTAFVVAAAGLRVAKHGNRAVSSRCGSADVIEALGINLALTPEQVAQCVNEVGIGFLFAPQLHGAMRYAIGPRREIGIRTIFNILGPLTNPAGANVQVLGVYDASLTEPLARVLGRLGSKSAFVVFGEGSFDEISIIGPT
ncbi:MAG: anthranilate phosphoribosyltransferase, partial [Deltaproteobacteria bacterium]|nr:anthranilate phosphoribosyltransferase [Deltaproteobacteria bacterium]